MDWILWGSIAVLIVTALLEAIGVHQLHHFVMGSSDLLITMAPGMAVAVVSVGLLHHVPRSQVARILGTQKGIQGLMRATVAGVFLDLCNHGILAVGMKLYERGATLGQTVAFILASPWNSFSLTIVLVSLIGLKYTIIFIVLSMILGLTTGYLMDYFVAKGTLPKNPYANLPDSADDGFQWKTIWSPDSLKSILKNGFKHSRVVFRWLFFGIVLAGGLRAVFSPELYAEFLGPTWKGLLVTMVGATIIEVCSEGLTPLAADILRIAKAPGNSFAFLMAGVATDYTEVLSLKDTTKSWKIALFMPLIAVPQVVAIAWILNHY